MKRTGRALFYCAILAFSAACAMFAAGAFAQEGLSLSISAEKEEVSEGEEFLLTYSISVEKPEEFSVIGMPGFKGFVIMGERKSSMVRLMGSGAYTTFIYEYRLKPEKGSSKKGVLQIGRVSFVYSGATYKTASLDIKITPPVAVPRKEKVASKPKKTEKEKPPSPQPNPSPKTSPKKPDKVDTDIANTGKKDNKVVEDVPIDSKKEAKVEHQLKIHGQRRGEFFVSALVDKAAPFLGERIIYRFRFYHAIDYTGAPAFTPPAFTGFFVEELPQSRSVEDAGERIVEEVNYALFPLVTGKVSISGATLEYKENGNIVNMLKSNTVDVNVKALPKAEAGKTAAFSGSVGVFEINQEYEAGKFVVDEPFSLTVTINGEGNIAGIREPYFANTDDFAYSLVDMRENIVKSIDNLSGGKDFIYSVTPKKEGKLAFDGAGYVYFDPDGGKYTEIRAKSFSIEAAPNEKIAGQKEKIPLDLSGIIAPARVGVKIRKRYMFYKSNAFFSILIALFSMSLLTLSFSYKKSYELKNKETITRKRAIKTALNDIEDARAHLHNQKIEDFYIQVYSLLNRLFIDRYGVDLTLNPLDSIEGGINGGPKAKGLIKDLVDKVKLLNYFRYSKEVTTEDELAEYLNELKKNIKELKKCKM